MCKVIKSGDFLLLLLCTWGRATGCTQLSDRRNQMDRPATTVWNPMPTATCPGVPEEQGLVGNCISARARETDVTNVQIARDNFDSASQMHNEQLLDYGLKFRTGNNFGTWNRSLNPQWSIDDPSYIDWNRGRRRCKVAGLGRSEVLISYCRNIRRFINLVWDPVCAGEYEIPSVYLD